MGLMTLGGESQTNEIGCVEKSAFFEKAQPFLSAVAVLLVVAAGPLSQIILNQSDSNGHDAFCQDDDNFDVVQSGDYVSGVACSHEAPGKFTGGVPSQPQSSQTFMGGAVPPPRPPSANLLGRMPRSPSFLHPHPRSSGFRSAHPSFTTSEENSDVCCVTGQANSQPPQAFATVRKRTAPCRKLNFYSPESCAKFVASSTEPSMSPGSQRVTFSTFGKKDSPKSSFSIQPRSRGLLSQKFSKLKLNEEERSPRVDKQQTAIPSTTLVKSKGPKRPDSLPSQLDCYCLDPPASRKYKWICDFQQQLNQAESNRIKDLGSAEYSRLMKEEDKFADYMDRFYLTGRHT